MKIGEKAYLCGIISPGCGGNNFSIYTAVHAGYIFMPDANQWSAVGTCLIAGTQCIVNNNEDEDGA